MAFHDGLGAFASVLRLLPFVAELAAVWLLTRAAHRFVSRSVGKWGKYLRALLVCILAMPLIFAASAAAIFLLLITGVVHDHGAFGPFLLGLVGRTVVIWPLVVSRIVPTASRRTLTQDTAVGPVVGEAGSARSQGLPDGSFRSLAHSVRTWFTRRRMFAAAAIASVLSGASVVYSLTRGPGSYVECLREASEARTDAGVRAYLRYCSERFAAGANPRANAGGIQAGGGAGVTGYRSEYVSRPEELRTRSQIQAAINLANVRGDVEEEKRLRAYLSSLPAED